MGRRCRDLEAVVGRQTQRRAPVHDPGTERSVGVAHGLRQAGGSRAEHEDGVRVRPVDVQAQSFADVVDDFGEKAGSSKSTRCVASKCGASNSRAASSWITCVGAVRSSANATSDCFHAGLSVTSAHPSFRTAKRAIANSGRLDDMIATRVPVRTPRSSKHPSTRVAQAVEVAEAVLIVAEPNRDVLGQTIGRALEREVQRVAARVVHGRERCPRRSLHRDRPSSGDGVANRCRRLLRGGRHLRHDAREFRSRGERTSIRRRTFTRSSL